MFPFKENNFLKRWFGNESNAGNPETSPGGQKYAEDRRAKPVFVLGNELGFKPFYSAGFATAPAKINALPRDTGYNGSLPMGLLPKVEKPKPWQQLWKKS